MPSPSMLRLLLASLWLCPALVAASSSGETSMDFGFDEGSSDDASYAESTTGPRRQADLPVTPLTFAPPGTYGTPNAAGPSGDQASPRTPVNRVPLGDESPRTPTNPRPAANPATPGSPGVPQTPNRSGRAWTPDTPIGRNNFGQQGAPGSPQSSGPGTPGSGVAAVQQGSPHLRTVFAHLQQIQQNAPGYYRIVRVILSLPRNPPADRAGVLGQANAPGLDVPAWGALLADFSQIELEYLNVTNFLRQVHLDRFHGQSWVSERGYPKPLPEGYSQRKMGLDPREFEPFSESDAWNAVVISGAIPRGLKAPFNQVVMGFYTRNPLRTQPGTHGPPANRFEGRALLHCYRKVAADGFALDYQAAVGQRSAGRPLEVFQLDAGEQGGYNPCGNMLDPLMPR